MRFCVVMCAFKQICKLKKTRFFSERKKVFSKVFSCFCNSVYLCEKEAGLIKISYTQGPSALVVCVLGKQEGFSTSRSNNHPGSKTFTRCSKFDYIFSKPYLQVFAYLLVCATSAADICYHLGGSTLH